MASWMRAVANPDDSRSAQDAARRTEELLAIMRAAFWSEAPFNLEAKCRRVSAIVSER